MLELNTWILAYQISHSIQILSSLRLFTICISFLNQHVPLTGEFTSQFHNQGTSAEELFEGFRSPASHSPQPAQPCFKDLLSMKMIKVCVDEMD